MRLAPKGKAMKRLSSLLNMNITPKRAASGDHAGYNNSRYKRFSNSRIWFAACVPLISMFIEIFADRFALGVLVWVCCVVSWTLSCLLDRRYLRQNGVDVSSLSPLTALLPPLYIFKRITITGDQNTAAIVFICFAFYAACANGFSQGIAMNDDKMIGHIKDNYWSNISNLSGVEGTDALRSIGSCIDPDEGKLGGKARAEWKAVRKDDIVIVTVKCGDLTMKFEETFDGFTFTDMKLVYFNDGMNEAFYRKNSDNTVFKKYVGNYLKSVSEKKSEKPDSTASENSSDKTDDASESQAEKTA